MLLLQANLSEAETPTLHLSTSHDGEYVISFVVAEQRKLSKS